MPSPLSEPGLTLACDNIHQLRDIDCDTIFSIWTVFTQCKENLLNGQRLENLSWRLWFRQVSSERKHTPLNAAEFGRKFSSGIGPEDCSRSAPTARGNFAITLNGLPRQISASCLLNLISPITTSLKLIKDNINSFSTILDELDLSNPSLLTTKCIVSVSNDISKLMTPNEIETTSAVSTEDRTRKIFFIPDSLEEEDSIDTGSCDKFTNTRTAKTLTHFSNDSAPNLSASIDSESVINADEDWESIASSYQSTLSTNSSCIFEKIQVPKQMTQYEPSKPSLLSTLFQKCPSTSIPYSKPSLFKDLYVLSTLDNEYEDPLAKELSKSLHQNVLWQRQQHEHFCHPCRKQQTSSIKLEDCIITSPGYYGCGW